MNDVAIGRLIQSTKVKPPVRRLPKRRLIVGAVFLILAGAGGYGCPGIICSGGSP